MVHECALQKTHKPERIPVINTTVFSIAPAFIEVPDDFSSLEDLVRREVLPAWRVLRGADVPDGSRLTFPFSMPWEGIRIDATPVDLGDPLSPIYEELTVWKDGDFVFSCFIKHTTSKLETSIMNISNYLAREELSL